MQIFDSYVSESPFDEVYDNDKNIRERWKNVIEDIEHSGVELLNKKRAELDWHLQDNGVTYNVYDEKDMPSSRTWNLDPIPFVIDESEWEHITLGLRQRAKLFNLILKDLYSEQKLIKENIVPAEVIFGNKSFCSEVFNFGDKKDFNLYLYGTDIARGPDGKMWVISDKASAPSGLGYAIENRLTMNVVANELYPNVTKKKLTSFMKDYKELLAPMIERLFVDIGLQKMLWPDNLGGDEHNQPESAYTITSAIEQIARADTGLAFLAAHSLALQASVALLLLKTIQLTIATSCRI